MQRQFNNNSGSSSSSNIEAKEFLDKMNIEYTEDTNTGEITVSGNLNVSNRKLKELPNLTMVIVRGGFHCDSNQLTTLKGAPQKVSGRFSCEHNQLITLEGAPQSVGINFYCNYNQLTTLKGAPQKVGGRFYCDNNLVDLKYSEPYDQYWIAPASIKQTPDKVTRAKKIADFRRFAKAREKNTNPHK